MSKEANSTLIGAFILGALAILVSGLLILASGQLSSRSQEYVLYFQGSVLGLSEGSPVNFRGVQVGKVTDIMVSVNPDSLDVQIPVKIEIDPDRVTRVGEKKDLVTDWFKGNGEIMEGLVKKGLRAQLELQSLITGRLLIELSFHPESDLLYVQDNLDLPQLPTIPSEFEELTRKIERIPIEELATQALEAVKSLEAFMSSPDLKEATGALAANLTTLQGIMSTTEQQLPKVLKQMEMTLASTNKAAGQLEKTLANIDQFTSEESELTYYATETMQEVKAASRAVRELAELLEREPEALLAGKGQ